MSEVIDMGIWAGLLNPNAKLGKKLAKQAAKLEAEKKIKRRPYVRRGKEADKEIAERVSNWLKANPYASRKQVQVKCQVNILRCERLLKEGLIEWLPHKQTSSIAATKGAKNNPWGDFKLAGTPEGGRKTTNKGSEA